MSPGVNGGIQVAPDELVSVRLVARNLYELLKDLESGSVEKYVLIDGATKMKAVLVTANRYSELTAWQVERA